MDKGVLLLHVNALAHIAQIAKATMHDCGFETMDHPPFSPDLASGIAMLTMNH